MKGEKIASFSSVLPHISTLAMELNIKTNATIRHLMNNLFTEVDWI